MLVVIGQFFIIFIVAVVMVGIKKRFRFKRVKPVDVTMPLWLYFTFVNWAPSTYYWFLPLALMPWLLITIVICIASFIKTGDLDLPRLIMFIWRIGDLYVPLIWLISIWI